MFPAAVYCLVYYFIICVSRSVLIHSWALERLCLIFQSFKKTRIRTFANYDNKESPGISIFGIFTISTPLSFLVFRAMFATSNQFHQNKFFVCFFVSNVCFFVCLFALNIKCFSYVKACWDVYWYETIGRP